VKPYLKRFLSAAIWIYFAALFAWLAAYMLSGDRFGLVSLVNILAVYLFLPLPVILLANLNLRQPPIWVAAGLGLVAFAWLWGGLFLPKPQRAAADTAGGETLSVLTYNVLGKQSYTAPQIETIRRLNADVVQIQELNHELAAAIESELRQAYPYQILDPQDDVEGMGVISRYPIHPSSESLPLEWLGTPQVLSLDWNGREITLVNFHMFPTTLSGLHLINVHNRFREDQARALVELARRVSPIIITGDANATPLSDTYAILASELEDVWVEAGFGLGHTFPGSDVSGTARPKIGGISAPQWLGRIDYIFHSPELRAVSTVNAPFDGVSDHRGVFAVLKWVGE
jgi:endonuclease/exonuclease/phosphatase (EEP) superfamily protein YafD